MHIFYIAFTSPFYSRFVSRYIAFFTFQYLICHGMNIWDFFGSQSKERVIVVLI
jgi:hypothetical protein